MSILSNRSVKPTTLDGHNARILSDVSGVNVVDEDIVGTVFVIPLEAAIPDQLREAHVSSGSLYKRLSPLGGLPKDADFGFIPLSGLELSDLSQAWADFSCPHKVKVLLDLPGALYSTMFNVGYKQTGLTSISWDLVAGALQARLVARQRVSDTNPTLSPMREGVLKSLRATPGAAEDPTDDDYVNDDFEAL